MGRASVGVVSSLKGWTFLMLIIQGRDASFIRKLKLDQRSNTMPLIFLGLEPKEARYA